MSDPTHPPADHSVKVPHLVFGLLFLGVAGIWALGASNAISGEHLAVLGPAVLILAGVVGLAASLANGRNRRRRTVPVDQRTDSYDAFESTSDYSGTTTDTTLDTTLDTATHPTTDHVTDDGDESTEEIR